MKWTIPAKTFLLGEYVAIKGFPAILLTTSPCFEVILSEQIGLQDIHPESPAGRWWLSHGFSDCGLVWSDPYNGLGGLGASSAQFLGAYFAYCHVMKKPVIQNELLEVYWQFAWEGQGARPSGYDVLAQSLQGCVYIDGEKAQIASYAWPFDDLAFILLHTGQKLATHHHLQDLSMPDDIQQLTTIVEMGKLAFEMADSQQMISAVNQYHQQLVRMKLVAEHSMQQIERLHNHSGIVAIKGCGAMGADVLLLLTPANQLDGVINELTARNLVILATNRTLYSNSF